MKLRMVAITGLMLGAIAARLGAQDTLYFPATDRIAIRNLYSIPTVDVAPRVHVHTIVGATGSVSLGELDSAGVAPLHHHTREQADVALNGAINVTIGDRVELLGPDAGMIIPPNVQHSIANMHQGVKAALEFHTVRRPDLVPPRPAMTFPAAPAPAEPPGAALTTQLDVGNGATLKGETCTMRWRRLASSVDLHPEATATELFVYVARGSVRLAGVGNGAPLGPGTVIIIPAGTRHVRASPAPGGDAGLIEFQVLSR